MRVARRRARFETRDPPASRLLKRSPQCGQAPARVGSSGTSEEQHNWERKRMLRIPPPTSEVTSLAIGHPHRDVALNRHIDLRMSFRSLAERRHRRVHVARAHSARCAMTPDCHRCGTARQRQGQRPNCPLGALHLWGTEIYRFNGTIPPPTIQ